MTNTEIAKQKWEARLAFSSYTADRKVDISQRPQERKTRFLPKELQQILNLMVAKCPKCKGTGTRICSKQHLEQQHQIIIPTYADLIKSIETKTAEAKRMKLNRTQNSGTRRKFHKGIYKLYKSIPRRTEYISVDVHDR